MRQELSINALVTRLVAARPARRRAAAIAPAADEEHGRVVQLGEVGARRGSVIGFLVGGAR